MKEMQRYQMTLLLRIQLILNLVITLLSYRLLTTFKKRSLHRKESTTNYPGINIKEF
jgi:hypothetical protein